MNKLMRYPFLITLAVLAIAGGLFASQKNALVSRINPQLTTSKAGFNDIVIQARGTNNKEKIALYINNTPVTFWNLSNNFQDYTYTPNGEITVSELSIHFLNDTWEPENNINYDVQIPYITVNGTKYNSEHSSTVSTGSWDQDSWCAPGNKQTQWLHCNGSFTYNIPQGTVVGLPTPTDSLTFTKQPEVINIIDNSATITWTINEGSQGYVYYGTTTNYGLQSQGDYAFNNTTHTQVLSGLAPDTTYFYKVVSANEQSETVTAEGSFVTLEGVVAPNVFDISSNDVIDITDNTATVIWSLSQSAQGYVDYGTTLNYNLRSIPELTFTYDSHIQKLTNLLPDTQYYYRIVSTTQNGEVGTKTGSFTTTNSGGSGTGPTEPAYDILTDQGFTERFSSTPSQSDVGKTIEAYFNGPSWSNGIPLPYQVYKREDAIGDPADTVVLDPIDGKPAVRAVIYYDEAVRKYSGFHVQGEQFGTNGLTDKNAAFCVEIYVPELAEGGLQTPNGAYLGMGHFVASIPNDNTVAGGGNFSKTSFSVRLTQKTSTSSSPGKLAPYYYGIREYEKNQADPTFSQGTSIATNIDFETYVRGRWANICLEVKPNTTPSARDGWFKVYIDDVLKDEVQNIRMWGDMNMRWKGWGTFLSQRYQNNPNNSSIYYRNYKIFSNP